MLQNQLLRTRWLSLAGCSGVNCGLLLVVGLAFLACRPDQIEHLKDTKRIGIETANWEVKRIMPQDLLRATRWAGDSLTATADTLLRRTLARELAAGGVARAAAFCRPEKYRLVDSLASVLKAMPHRVNTSGRTVKQPAVQPPDTTRLVRRESPEIFFYERPIVLNNTLCLHCHGEVGADISTADDALLRQQFPQHHATGYRLGQVMGAWQVRAQRAGVAEFWTMKTRKKWKEHKLPKLF